MSMTERFLVSAGAWLLPRKAAYRLARAALATQGVGWAGPASGLHGSGEAKFLERRIGHLERPCVFDVGANVGEYSAATLRANPAARLHCFEPSAAHLAVLRTRIAESSAIVNAFGLSDSASTQSLHKDREVTGLASLIERDLGHLNIRLDHLETVHLEVGDAYVRRHGIDRIDLLKIDVEGWEMSVLRGFADAFERRIVACCQFEFGHAHIERRENFRDFWRFFVERGYTLGALKPNGRVEAMSGYDEILENYYATNYIAALSREATR
jgi:FkbM family methyltransferase